MMSEATTNELVIEFSRALIMEVAPEELPSFKSASKAYLKDPKQLLATYEVREKPTSFGVADILPLFTPAVLTVAGAVINFLIKEVLKATSAESSSLIQSKVRGLFKLFQGKEAEEKLAVPALTREQMKELRKILAQEIGKTKLPDDYAKVLTNAIIGRVAISVGGEP
jgi:hypothetical protein